MDGLSTKESCQKCRGCCKFEEDEIYFAPLFTNQEIAALGDNGAFFKKYKNHDNVMQIELVESNGLYVCPFLDEGEHLCRIYSLRPFDCRIWPFIFMKDKKGAVVLACFDRDMCPWMEEMSDSEFDKLKERVLFWLDKEEVVDFVLKNPGLIWDYEVDTFIVREIGEIN